MATTSAKMMKTIAVRKRPHSYPVSASGTRRTLPRSPSRFCGYCSSGAIVSPNPSSWLQ